MDFTREPIIETVVTPKEGCKLVVRSSKANGQEEYFVDSVEVVSFGSSVFFRSQERPKAFIVPASDYEVLEVREARMVLKNVGLDRSIKIGGGRENQRSQPKEQVQREQVQREQPQKEQPGEKAAEMQQEEELHSAGSSQDVSQNGQNNRKKDRRRQYRKRRGREDGMLTENEVENEVSQGESLSPSEAKGFASKEASGEIVPPPVINNVMLAPPPMLISETIARYKDNALFKGAFYTKEELVKEAVTEEAVQAPGLSAPTLSAPEYGSFEVSEQEEEAIYQERMQKPFLKEEDDIPPTPHFGEEQFPEKDYSRPSEHS